MTTPEHRPLLLAGLLVLLAACGGEMAEEAPVSTQSLALPLLAFTPDGYVEPPALPIPEDVSEDRRVQSARSAMRWKNRAIACARRYAPMIEEINARPHDGIWQVTHTREQAITTLRHDGKDGDDYFTVRLDLDHEEVDNCTLIDGSGQAAYGVTDGGYALVDHGSFMLGWTNNTIALVWVTPVGPFGQLLRGYDPRRKVSFGWVETFGGTKDPTRCWTADQKFVSCDGTDTWPFD